MNNSNTDKYFGDLDRYDKPLVPHKRAFFKDCQGLSLCFIELLKMFSFNLDCNSPTYRWGKRYYDNETKSFQWVTSNKGKISRLIKDKDTGNLKRIDSKVRFTEKDIENHFLGCFGINRKPNFYYKSSDLDKIVYDKYPNALANIFKMDGKIFGASQYLNSDILLIDIDNYFTEKAIDKLKFFLNHCNLKISDLLFIEQNALKGGIHCALKLPEKITDPEIYKNIMNYFTNIGCRIECSFINNILRFPLSWEYVAIKHNENILNTDEFISQEYWEDTFEHYLNNLNWKPCNSKVLMDIIHNNPKELKTVSKYNNYWKQEKHIIKRVNERGPITPKFKKFYKITAGNRYNTLSKLIPYCKLLGYDLDQTINIIYSVNESSKDLGRWSRERLYNNIKSFYNKCQPSLDLDFKPTDYIPSIHNIPTQVLEMLKDENIMNKLVNDFIREYIKARNHHNENFDHISQEKIDIWRKILPIMFIEMIGKMYYEINNPKEFTNGSKEDLGFQLPDCVLKALQSYAIRLCKIDSPIAKTSLQYLKKALMNTLRLKEIQYKNRKRNWQLGSCKSFNIKSLNDLNNLLNHLYNSVYKDIVINDFIHNKNNIISTIILYILLQQNSQFDILTGEILDKYDKSPPD